MRLFFTFILLLSVPVWGQIYVATDGDDSNPGTKDMPFKNITAAVSLAQPGDTIYIRGGVYNFNSTISISKSGTEENKHFMQGYQGERPLLDFSSMAVSGSNRGISLSGNYWYIKGIDIKGAGDNGMFIRGSNNTVEFCSFYENHDTGLQLGNGASDNKVINCDSYFNADPGEGNADGFAAKLDVGTNNYFYGCRAWQNSDDGWDGYLRGADDISTIVENSWCFANGYLKDGNPSSGNGNGYKMGGGDNGNSANLANDFTLINSIAFDNRVKGFDQNNNRGSMTLYNCSAYRNGTNYSIPSVINSDETATVINCAVLGNIGNLAGFVVQQTNSWLSPFTTTNDDFISVDTTGVRGPRNPDGSLPHIDFLHLAEGSDLINSGTDIGLPFTGTGPDLGAFEFGDVIPVDLISFSGSVSGESVLLEWITASEINNYGFEVQRRINGSGFTAIGFVPGSGTTGEIKKYKFLHSNPEKGMIIYRIKQIDFSGAFIYSEELEINNAVPAEFALLQNYPNPFNPVTNFEFKIADPGLVLLKVFDPLGKEVASLVNEEKSPGIYKVFFNASGLSSGTYYYILKQGENILSGKMLLLK